MAQIKGTLAAGNNEITTASSEAGSVSIYIDGDVTIAFAEEADADSFPVLGNAIQSFTGRSFTTKNINLYSAAGGEAYKIIW